MGHISAAVMLHHNFILLSHTVSQGDVLRGGICVMVSPSRKILQREL